MNLIQCSLPFSGQESPGGSSRTEFLNSGVLTAKSTTCWLTLITVYTMCMYTHAYCMVFSKIRFTQRFTLVATGTF